MRQHDGYVLALTFVSLAIWTGCGDPAATAVQTKEPPAKVSNGGLKETNLATITLSEDARRRLGIEIATAGEGSGNRTGTWTGEAVVPPGRTLTVSAPVAGTTSFALQGTPAAGARVKHNDALIHLRPMLPAERDLRVSVEAEVSASQTRAEAARARYERAEQLLRDRVGSVKAKEAAQEELALAATALSTARAKLQRLNQAPLEADVTVAIRSPQDGILKTFHVAEGQMVATGAPLFEVERLDTVWIKVPVYAGEVGALARGASATVRPLDTDASAPERRAEPVLAPPSADPAAATVDLYFSLSNEDLSMRPGQKVSATLALRGEVRGLMIPAAAVLFDIHGGAWVYEQISPLEFSRRRVEVARASGGKVLVTRGLQPGAKVVTAGAAELFGTEFSTGK